MHALNAHVLLPATLNSLQQVFLQRQQEASTANHVR